MIDRINRVGQMQQMQNVSEAKGKEERRAERSVVKAEPDSLVVQEGKRIAQYIQMAKEYPEVRQALVNALREAIENGTFKVDPGKIARKILEG